eukprot:jgi/Tetstr1/429707/TSEL_019602.t1
MTYVAKWCLHADKREDTGPGDACYLLTLVPAALTLVARLGSMSSMTEHAANIELPGLIAPTASHWVELRMDWLALLPTLPPWRAAPPAPATAPDPRAGPVPPAHPLPPAPDLIPFMPTSTNGTQTQVGAPLQWALDNPDFFLPCVRDTAVRTSPRIPTSARDAIGAAIRPIWDISHSARGVMREPACHLAIIFPAAFLWSHAAGANAHVVRTAIDHRLALWRQGDILLALLHEAALARETIQPTASGPATSRGYLRGRIS